MSHLMHQRTGAETGARTLIATLPRERLTRMAEAGRAVMRWHDVLQRSGDTIISALMPPGRQGQDWQRNPEGDVIDRAAGSAYFFHHHPRVDRTDRQADSECGHFHAFIRTGPADGLRIDMPGTPASTGHELRAMEHAAVCHLTGIGIDAFGLPCRLFTTNRWVTGETWRPAHDITPLIDRFAIGHARPNFIINQWLTEMLRLFQPHIALLLTQRDRVLATQPGGNGQPPTEHRTLEIPSEMAISLPQTIGAVTEALEQLESRHGMRTGRNQPPTDPGTAQTASAG